MYAIVIGQLIPSLQSIIKGGSEYISKSKGFGAICLLNKVKKITAGANTKTNPAHILHENIMALSTIRHGRK